MNNEVYSSYPSEGEILLKESAIIDILGHDEVEIKNKHPLMRSFTGKKVTVIHIFVSGFDD